MNTRNFITFFIAIFVSLPFANIASSQAVRARTEVTATAHIPFDFWVGGALLPAGDYSISPGAPSALMFWNQKEDVGEQAFLLSTGDSVASGDYKLIFVVHDGQHHLRAIWYVAGKALLTSQLYVPLLSGDTEADVKLLEHKHVTEVAGARQ